MKTGTEGYISYYFIYMTIWKNTKPLEEKTDIFLVKTGAGRKVSNTKGHGENWNDRNVLYLFYGIYIHQNTSNCTSKRI